VTAIENGRYAHLSKTQQLNNHFQSTQLGHVHELEKEVEKLAKMPSIEVEKIIVDPVRHIQQLALSAR
jgi:hypothetical protein